MSTMDQRDEPEIKVEWDPERYEESMAAIEAWAPEGVWVRLEDQDFSIGCANFTW